MARQNRTPTLTSFRSCALNHAAAVAARQSVLPLEAAPRHRAVLRSSSPRPGCFPGRDFVRHHPPRARRIDLRTGVLSYRWRGCLQDSRSGQDRVLHGRHFFVNAIRRVKVQKRHISGTSQSQPFLAPRSGRSLTLKRPQHALDLVVPQVISAELTARDVQPKEFFTPPRFHVILHSAVEKIQIVLKMLPELKSPSLTNQPGSECLSTLRAARPWAGRSPP
jgi:hypothetical protein